MSFSPSSRSRLCNVVGGVLGIVLIVVLLLGILSVSVVQVLADGMPSEVWVDDDYTSSTPGWGETHFKKIQDGINAVAEGGIVHVAAGTYNEHVIINKPLTLLGAQADVDPTVEGARTDPSLESIIIGTGGGYDGAAIVIELPEATEKFEVIINGFTIKNPEGDYGIILPTSPEEPPYKDAIIEYNIITECGFGIESWYGEAAGDLIRNNLIADNTYYGVESYCWYKTIALTIEGNKFTGNKAGIYMCDVGTIVRNNIFENNKYGIYVHYSDGSIAHYNNFAGNTEYGVYNEGEPVIDATHNWWGNPRGPSGVGPGTGDAVSDYVDFDPWLTAPITVASSKSVTNTWLEFPESRVGVYVSGTAEVYVATYEYNPGARLAGSIENYIDVYVPDITGLDELEIRKYYTDDEIAALGLDEGSLMLYWWDGSAWIPCSDTGVNTEENYIWAKIRDDTTPKLTELTGTPFGAASRPPVRPPVGGEILSMNEPAIVMLLIQKNLGYIILTALAIVAVVAVIKRRC